MIFNFSMLNKPLRPTTTFVFVIMNSNSKVLALKGVNKRRESKMLGKERARVERECSKGQHDPDGAGGAQYRRAGAAQQHGVVEVYSGMSLVKSKCPVVSTSKLTGSPQTSRVNANIQHPITEIDNSAVGRMAVDVAASFTQEELYDRIFHKKPKWVDGNISWGRIFLRDNFKVQWRTYNQNIRTVRSWFSDPENQFVRSNLRSGKDSVAAVKDFIKAREPSLAALLFISSGAVLHMRWQVGDIYEWFKGFKHYSRRRGRNSPVKLAQIEGTIPAEENVVPSKLEEDNKKRKRVPSLKAVQSIPDGVSRKKKRRFARQKDIEDRVNKFLYDAEATVYQGLQLKALTDASKKTLAMVVMGLDKVFDVLPNILSFVGKTLPEFQIKLKRDDLWQSRMQARLLDVVVVWALKDFKVGIVNPPPIRNETQQLFVENIKKLF